MSRHKNPNGEGYCRKIDKNKYECTIMSKYINPTTLKEKRIKRVGISEADARKRAKQALKAWEREYILNKQDIKIDKTKTFGQYMNEFLETLIGTITDSCYRSYTSAMKRLFFSHPISKLQLQMLSELEFQTYYEDILSHYSRKTCNLPMQLCKRCMSNLESRHLVERNFAEITIKNKKADEYYSNLNKKDKKEIFSKEDIEKLYEAFKNHRGQYAVVAIFLLETGMRTSEFAALQNSDIDLKNKIITVCKTRGLRYKDNTNKEGIEEYIKVTKNNKERIIPISKICEECIIEMQTQTAILCKDNYNDLLYPTFQNGRMRSNSAMEVGFKLLCDNLAIDRAVERQRNGNIKGLCLHSLRHTAVSYMKTQNASESTISSIIGHSEKVDNDIYTHQNIETVKSIKSTLDVLNINNEETETIQITKEDLELLKKIKSILQ